MFFNYFLSVMIRVPKTLVVGWEVSINDIKEYCREKARSYFLL